MGGFGIIDLPPQRAVLLLGTAITAVRRSGQLRADFLLELWAVEMALSAGGAVLLVRTYTQFANTAHFAVAPLSAWIEGPPIAALLYGNKMLLDLSGDSAFVSPQLTGDFGNGPTAVKTTLYRYSVI